MYPTTYRIITASFLYLPGFSMRKAALLESFIHLGGGKVVACCGCNNSLTHKAAIHYTATARCRARYTELFHPHPMTLPCLCKFHFPVIHSPRLVSIDGRKLESREGTANPVLPVGPILGSPNCHQTPCLLDHPVLNYLSKAYATWWIMPGLSINWLVFI